MRKISKSRTDDDVVSSTNGSVANDDNNVDEHVDNDDGDKEEDTEANDSFDKISDDKSETSVKESSKKGKSKRGRKKKQQKKKEKDEDEEEEDEEEEYEVEKIVDSKKIKGRVHYLIRWKGYSADSDTWEPEDTLSCPELISKFNDEKENSKDKEKSPKKGRPKSLKRKSSKKESKTPSKKPKTEWDSKNADKNAEYEVERILEVHHKKNGKRDFLIHWKGWSSKFDSWEPESNLNCPDLIEKFMEKVSSAKSSESRNLRVAPENTKRFTLQAPSSGRRLSKRHGQAQRVRYDNAE